MVHILSSKMTTIGWSIQTAIKVFEYVVFVSLLIPTFFLVKPSIKEYLDSRTLMEEFEEPLTVRDMPSLNLCFGKFYLQYGRNIQITMFDHQNETMKPLREGENYVDGH